MARKNFTDTTIAPAYDHSSIARMRTSERMTDPQKKGDTNKMTINELKRMHLKKNDGSHWFDPDTLRFFGESLSRMKVLKKTVTVTDTLGEEHECYVVSAIRTKDWSGTVKPYTFYHYFDVETMQAVSINR